MDNSILNFSINTAVMILLLLNPLGNVPAFVGILRNYSNREYYHIICREMILALCVMMTFLFFGTRILTLLGISTISLSIAGGIILFMVASKMIFSSAEHTESRRDREPFLVPLAFPLFAGPSTITMIILIHAKPGTPVLGMVFGIFAAWVLSFLILLIGRSLQRLLGEKVLDALESLMGFMLTVVAVQMLINGLALAFPGIMN